MKTVEYKGIRNLYQVSYDFGPILLIGMCIGEKLTGIIEEGEYAIYTHNKFMPIEYYKYKEKYSIRMQYTYRNNIRFLKYENNNSRIKRAKIDKNNKISFKEIKRICKNGGSGYNIIH